MQRGVVVGVVSALTLGAAVTAAAPPQTDTRYVAELRRSAAQVDAAARGVATLTPRSRTKVEVAQRMATAAAAACRTMRAYQNATTRYGTEEEARLVQAMQAQLTRARSSLGSIAGVKTETPTAHQRSTAEQLLREVAGQAAAEEVGNWVGDQQLGVVLTSGDLREVRSNLQREVTRRINAAARDLSRRAIGLSLSLDAPLKAQVRAQADQAALAWLARTVLRWDPTGLAIQLVGIPIARFLRAELKEAFRTHTHVAERVARSTEGFTARERELQRLIDGADTASLEEASRLLTRARRALDATAYLESDLRKQGRAELLARLEGAKSRLAGKVKEVRAAMLLDSWLATTGVRRLADDACRLHGQLLEIARKLASDKPEGTDQIVGDWRSQRGLIRISQTGPTALVGKLIEKGCQKTGFSIGQVEVRLTKTGPTKYMSTLRAYDPSCRTEGEVKVEWTYEPGPGTQVDVLRSACYMSPAQLGRSTCEGWARFD